MPMPFESNLIPIGIGCSKGEKIALRITDNVEFAVFEWTDVSMYLCTDMNSDSSDFIPLSRVNKYPDNAGLPVIL